MKEQAVLLALILLALTTAPLNARDQTKQTDFTLQSIHKNLTKDYNTIKHLPAKSLLNDLQTEERDNWLIFDVRQRQEFEVSHIAGAHHLNPNTWLNAFMKNYGSTVKGKQVVFYCSVGVRSSKMASYLKDELMKRGARDVYNLKKGLFSWANKGHPLQNANGTTSFIHPYNNHWGQLIQSKEMQSYSVK